jgi:hypothetical protein
MGNSRCSSQRVAGIEQKLLFVWEGTILCQRLCVLACF